MIIMMIVNMIMMIGNEITRKLNRNKNYNYLRTLEVDSIQQNEIQGRVNFKRTRKTLETRLNDRTMIKTYNYVYPGLFSKLDKGRIEKFGSK